MCVCVCACVATRAEGVSSYIHTRYRGDTAETSNPKYHERREVFRRRNVAFCSFFSYEFYSWRKLTISSLFTLISFKTRILPIDKLSVPLAITLPLGARKVRQLSNWKLRFHRARRGRVGSPLARNYSLGGRFQLSRLNYARAQDVFLQVAVRSILRNEILTLPWNEPSFVHSCARMHSFAAIVSRRERTSWRSRNSTGRIVTMHRTCRTGIGQVILRFVRRNPTDNEAFYFQTRGSLPFTFIITMDEVSLFHLFRGRAYAAGKARTRKHLASQKAE